MKSIKLILLAIVLVIASNSTVFGINPKAIGGKIFEYHSNTAILLFPIYLPLIALKLTADTEALRMDRKQITAVFSASPRLW